MVSVSSLRLVPCETGPHRRASSKVFADATIFSTSLGHTCMWPVASESGRNGHPAPWREPGGNRETAKNLGGERRPRNRKSLQSLEGGIQASHTPEDSGRSATPISKLRLSKTCGIKSVTHGYKYFECHFVVLIEITCHQKWLNRQPSLPASTALS